MISHRPHQFFSDEFLILFLLRVATWSNGKWWEHCTLNAAIWYPAVCISAVVNKSGIVWQKCQLCQDNTALLPSVSSVSTTQLYCQVSALSVQHSFIAKCQLCQYNTALLPSVNTTQLYCQVSVQNNFNAKCQYKTTLMPSVDTKQLFSQVLIQLR